MILKRTFAREARAINHQHDILLKELRSAGERAADIGATIQRVRDGLPYGSFENWVEEHLSFGVRMAQKYMAFFAKARTLDSPSQELLAAEWQEFSHPACHSKAHQGAPLGDMERAELMRTEGAVEPEELDWIPEPGHMSVGRYQRGEEEVLVFLVHDATTPDVVRPYFVSEHGLADVELVGDAQVLSAEEVQGLGYGSDDEILVETLPVDELPTVDDGSDGGVLETFRHGVYVSAMPTVLAYLKIDLAEVDWSGPGPLDGDFIGELQKMTV